MSKHKGGSARLWVFRVEEGLGNACLLGLPDGRFGVVDWGTSNPTTLGVALKIVGRARVAFVLATHPHEDHTLGMVQLLRGLLEQGSNVERFAFSSSTLREGATLTEARTFALDNLITQSPVFAAVEETPSGPRVNAPYLAFGDDWEVRVLCPTADRVARADVAANKKGRSPGNETSAVVLFSFVGSTGRDRVLLPGDVTPRTLGTARQLEALERRLSLHNGLIVVPHHGSNRNLPKWFFSYLNGAVAVSAPSNSEHHPNRHVLRAIARHRPGLLYCTCEALACRIARSRGRSRHVEARLAAQPCFGDLEFLIERGRPPDLVESSHDGERHRAGGICVDGG